MAKENNLTDFLTDVADAIREKKGTTEKINPQDFSDEIKSIKTSTSMWTGHVDVEGLKAIGWDDDDIAYYQRYGVNWNEEDDQYHLVSDDNKALYGVLTADNIQEYKDRIVYLPKIDISKKQNINNMFIDCNRMEAIPMLDTSNVTTVFSAFRRCFALRYIPDLSLSKTRGADCIFYECRSLTRVPKMVFEGNSCETMFSHCSALRDLNIDIGQPSLLHSIFSNCYSLKNIGEIDFSKASSRSPFSNCYCLENIKLIGLHQSFSFSESALLTKDSLLYMINHESTTEAIIITLHADAYSRLSTDQDIVAALENHTNVSLASA